MKLAERQSSAAGMFAGAGEGFKLFNKTVPDRSIQHKVIPEQGDIHLSAVPSFPKGADQPRPNLTPSPSLSQTYNSRDNMAGTVRKHGAAAPRPYRPITTIFRNLLDQYPRGFTLEASSPVVSIEHDDQKTGSPIRHYPERHHRRLRDQPLYERAARLIPNLMDDCIP